MVRVVAGSNVYISAFNFRGRISKVLEFAQQGQIGLFVSPPILDEFQRVLSEKFEWTEDRVRRAVANILEFTYLISTEPSLSVICEDPTDNRILECAVESKAEFIVTGDKHLLKLKRFRSIDIVGPRRFLELMARAGS